MHSELISDKVDIFQNKTYFTVIKVYKTIEFP